MVEDDWPLTNHSANRNERETSSFSFFCSERNSPQTLNGQSNPIIQSFQLSSKSTSIRSCLFQSQTQQSSKTIRTNSFKTIVNHFLSIENDSILEYQ